MLKVVIGLGLLLYGAYIAACAFCIPVLQIDDTEKQIVIHSFPYNTTVRKDDVLHAEMKIIAHDDLEFSGNLVSNHIGLCRKDGFTAIRKNTNYL